MSDIKKIDARHAAMAATEIQRLIDNPPLPRTQPLDRPEDFGSSMPGVAEYFMQLAIRATKLSRDDIVRQWGKEAYPEALPLTEAPRGLARERARKAKMPDKYRESVIDRPPNDCQALRAVKEFLKSKHKLMMLSGGHGTWKSGSACYAIGQVDGSRYVDAIELVDVKLRDQVRFDELMGARLVVLDDLGWEDKHPVQRAMFFDAWMRLVVNAYTRGNRLIVTGNILFDDFVRSEDKGGYGVLAADRWAESGEWHDIEGESQRPKMRDLPPAHWSDQEDDD